MNFIAAAHTDMGIRKNTNQDAVLIEQAQTEYGSVIFAAVCDGMGGLAKGEVASAVLIRRLSSWFHNEFPDLLYREFSPETLRERWEELIFNTNYHIMQYGENQHITLGTTCVAFLAFGSTYYLMNIGDSRAYMIDDKVYQLTKDQTYCQREIDLGRMTPEQAEIDPQRSVLLQCVGANATVEPDFFAGMMQPDQCFMLCSDGFRHVITPQELYDKLSPAISTNEDTIKQNLTYLVELNKSRNEKDNISALLIRTV